MSPRQGIGVFIGNCTISVAVAVSAHSDHCPPAPSHTVVMLLLSGGSIVIEGAESNTITNCAFIRLGGNAIALSGHAWHTTITQSEFFKIGDSAIVSVGDFKLNDGVSSDAYPLGTMITDSHFHEIGVTGKQTSALFSATSCRSTFSRNVAYNGPRAGETISALHLLTVHRFYPRQLLPTTAEVILLTSRWGLILGYYNCTFGSSLRTAALNCVLF